MADLVITAADVDPASGAIVKRKTAAVAITAGQPCYYDADGKADLADADAQTTAAAKGIAVNDAAADQFINILEEGDIDDIGGTMTIGETYVVSTTAGGIAPIGDLASGDFTTILGIAETAIKLPVKITIGAAAKA